MAQEYLHNKQPFPMPVIKYTSYTIKIHRDDKTTNILDIFIYNHNTNTMSALDN